MNLRLFPVFFLLICFILSIGLAIFYPIATAEAVELLPRHRFINLSTSDKSGINSLMQDDNGMIWAAGSSGLYRIEHNQLIKIRDFPVQAVNQLLLNPGQGAWLAGSLGLWRWDRQTDNFSQQECQPPGGLWQLVQPQQHADTMLALGPDGIWQVNTINGRCEHLQLSGLPAQSRVERLSFLHNELIIAVREQGLFRCELPCQQAERFAPELADVRFRALEVYQDSLYAGSHKHGFYQLDSAGKVRRHWHKGQANTLPVNGVMSLLPAKQGLWAGLWAGGLVEFNAKGEQHSHSSFRPTDPTAISGNNIKTLLTTRDGTLYAGHEYGVSVLLPALKQYQWLGQAQADQPGLRQSNVQALYATEQGDIWLGTSGGGLYRFDHAGETLQRFAPDETGVQHFPSQAVWAIRPDQDGTLLLATSSGVVRLHPDTQQWQLLTSDLPSQDVFRLSIAPDRNIWISMWSGGIAQLNAQGKVEALWRSSDGLQLDTNLAIEISPAGQVFALNTAGLFKLDGNKFSAVDLSGHGKARQLCKDAQGTLWILTDSGVLLRFDDHSGKFQLQLKRADLANGTELFAASADGPVSLWLRTKQRLAGIAADGQLLQQITLTGLMPETLLNTARIQGQQIILGAEDGFYIAPLQQSATPPVPEPQLTGVRLFNQPLRLTQPATTGSDPSALFGGLLTLQYQQDLVTFEFAMPGIVMPPAADLSANAQSVPLPAAQDSVPRFRYRLLPFDRDWLTAATDEPRATYTRLPPGQYQFELQTWWPDGRMTAAAPFQLEVQPPWWLTWWAKTTLAAALVLGVSSIMLLRTRSLKKRNLWLAQQVRERTEALQQANQRLQQAAYRDALTGLLNRRGLRAQTEPQWSGWQHQRVLVIADIDHFKQFNDVHGHQVGDEVLTALSERLQGLCLPDDLLARWGGEEFLFILQGSDAMQRADALIRSVAAAPMPLSIGPTPVTLTGGAVWLSGESLDATLQHADALLYNGKKAGRNRLVQGA
ncbi:ligand-binding sensor domain-containing diguanylate cyclase [Rheinheimera texasensis]|uniref:ligand-binding sensor domain-containing diguanylate cyclase n=1 Tax=Rheinheimera texasensis TaxID=306205 RepID=UPI0004E1331A|nr:ligand-binding sensor domain-containing diguanylate cyclase [Rheinheimera texasensis]